MLSLGPIEKLCCDLLFKNFVSTARFVVGSINCSVTEPFAEDSVMFITFVLNSILSPSRKNLGVFCLTINCFCVMMDFSPYAIERSFVCANVNHFHCVNASGIVNE